MKKTYSFLLTAGLVLATAFTLSCSDDKEEGTPPSPPSLSELTSTPQPLNLPEGVELTGTIPVFLRLDGYDLPAGQIQNGKLSLDLPSAQDMSGYIGSIQGATLSPSTLEISKPGQQFIVEIPGRSCEYGDGYENPYHDIEVIFVSSGVPQAKGWFIYASAEGTVTGTIYGINANLNLSQGWNMISAARTQLTSDLSGDSVLWRVQCGD